MIRPASASPDAACDPSQPAADAHATAALRYAWLQKHPTPTASAGEFHWHPPVARPTAGSRAGIAPDGAGDEHEVRAELVERARGVEPPAVLWSLAPGRVVWAHVFEATAPGDGRRYSGLAVAIAEGRRWLPSDLLDALSPPPAAPWTAGRTAAASQAGPRLTSVAMATAIAHGALRGGDVALPAPALAPGTVAAVERHLPTGVTGAPRRGCWRLGGRWRGPAPDALAALIAASALAPSTAAAAAWALLCDLAAAQARTVDEVMRDAVTGRHLDLEPRERAALREPITVRAALHAWGRGHLDHGGTESLLVRLADAIALRALAALLADQSASGPIAEVRWHALLPRARRSAVLAVLGLRASSLRHHWEAR
jgi:hypothetical protein